MEERGGGAMVGRPGELGRRPSNWGVRSMCRRRGTDARHSQQASSLDMLRDTASRPAASTCCATQPAGQQLCWGREKHGTGKGMVFLILASVIPDILFNSTSGTRLFDLLRH
jgi:hypothetical protein